MKSKDFIIKLMTMLYWGYVLGGQGELYSIELAEKWGNEGRAGKSKTYFMVDCARWFGHRIVDCSGMIIQAIRSAKPGYEDKTADELYLECTKRGSMKTIPEVPGICVRKPGHIGIYLGNGKVLESRGKDYGVVITNLHERPWTGWGYLADVEYYEQEQPKPKLERNLKYRLLIKMRGEDVRQLQERLLAMGCPPGKIDGVFGMKTRNAVLDFQYRHALKEDGIVGSATWGELFK
jgi:hypothetical protein